MKRDLNHPVWGVYDLYRSVKLNTEYYSEKLHRVGRLNSYAELIILITAPSSTISGLWFWKNPIGVELWKYLGVIAAFTIILKQVFELSKKFKDYSATLVSYRTLEQDLFVLCELIKAKGRYTAKFASDYERYLKKKAAIAGSTPDTKTNKKLKMKCLTIVNEQLPPENFWVPTIENN